MNNLGRGPNSSVTIVYSAEDMPVIQPTNIWANPTNATAGYANWELEGRSRENVRGTVLAFQVRERERERERETHTHKYATFFKTKDQLYPIS